MFSDRRKPCNHFCSVDKMWQHCLTHYLFGSFGVERLPDDKGAVDTQYVGASTEAFQLRGHRLLELQQVKDRNVHVRRSVTAKLKLDEDEEESFTLPANSMDAPSQSIKYICI